MSECPIAASEDSHGGRHSKGAEKHELSASHLLDDEDGDECSEQVLSTVTCSKELRQISLGQTNLAVQNRSIVGDQVDTRDLLEHLVDVRQADTVELAVVAHLEQGSVRTLAHFLDGGKHLLELSLDTRVVAAAVIDVREHLNSLIMLSFHHKPSRRLRQIENGAEDGHGKDNLEGKRESPSNLLLTDEGEAVVDPVRTADASSDKHSLNHHQLATLVRLRGLGLPSGDSTGVQAIANTSYETSDDQLCEGVSDRVSHDFESTINPPVQLRKKCTAEWHQLS